LSCITVVLAHAVPELRIILPFPTDFHDIILQRLTSSPAISEIFANEIGIFDV